MKDRSEIDELTLQAYLDGELDVSRKAEVEEWLHARPAEQARFDAWKKNDGALRAALNSVSDEAVPHRLRTALRSSRRRHGSFTAHFTQIAAATLLLIGGLASGWGARGYLSPDNALINSNLASRALDAHIVFAADLRHPVEVMANSHEHLNAWLSRRLQHKIAAPDLTTAGYSLIGGRLMSDKGKAAALFMYEDTVGKRLTLLVAQTEVYRNTQPAHMSREDVRAMSWSNGPLTLALAGSIDSDRLRGIGEIVQTSVQEKG